MAKKKGNSKTPGVKGIVKKAISLKIKLGIAGLIISILLLLFTIAGLAAMLFSISGVISQFLWEGGEQVEQADDGSCPCGCIWVGGEGQKEVIVNSITSSDMDELKLLGSAEMSWYSKQDNDDGAGNFNTDKTSSGADATPGITVALPDKETIGSPDKMEELGLKLGDWIYIEGVGVRQVQDRCGTKGRVDVYVDKENDSSVMAYSGKTLKIWLVKEGSLSDIQKGSQEGVVIPEVTSSTVNVPSYGPSTGSLEDTSKVNNNQIPVPTTENDKALLNHLLPGAVVASQYYNVHIRTVLGLAPAEGGWKPILDGTSNGYHLFSLMGKGPFTGTSTTGGWRTHVDYTDAILDYVINYKRTNHVNNAFDGAFSSEGYAAVIAAYEKGPEEQILKHALSGFNDYCDRRLPADQRAKNPEQYRQMAQNYADKILGYTRKFTEINNIDVAMAYIKANGLEDKYQEALEWKDKYEQKYNAGYANTTPNGGAEYTQQNKDSEGSSQGSAGHWVCACKKPCELCHCHDGETENTGSSGTVNMSFPPVIAGKASGLWGTAEQLAQWIEELDSTNAPNNANIAQLKINMRQLLPLMGMSSAKPFKYNTDKFVGPDGWGFIHYDQTSSGNEPYIKMHHQDGTSNGGTFNSSACGLYSLSMILSTLEKNWVNPAELAVALQTYGVRNNKRIYTTLMGNSGAAYWDGLYAITKEAGYSDALLSGQKIEQSVLDECLNKGGLAMYVTRDSEFTTSGHYVVIREKTSSGKYLMGNSTRRDNNEYTFEKLQSGCSYNALYIYPKPGKSINDMKKGNNSNEDQSTQVEAGLLGNAQPVVVMDNLSITSSWYRTSGEFHSAIDYGTPVGTPIKAIWGGKVTKAVDGNPTYGKFNGYGGSYGNHITIEHPNGTWSTYAHLEKGGVKVKVGDLVSQGQVIGASGSSGNSTGPHLHLELAVEWNTKVVNPNKLFEGYQLSELAIRTRGKGKLVQAGVE